MNRFEGTTENLASGFRARARGGTIDIWTERDRNSRDCGSRWTYHVSSQIDAQNGDGSERERNVAQDERQEGRDLRNVGCQRVRDRLLQVVENETALLDSGNDRSEVVIEQDHVSGLEAGEDREISRKVVHGEGTDCWRLCLGLARNNRRPS